MNRTRTLQIDPQARAKGQDDNCFPCTLSTEQPVERHFGFEILDHANADLSRSPIPVIESHDNSKLNLGVVEHLRIESKKLKGIIRMGTSARALEVARDIRDRILTSVSIGYELLSAGEAQPEIDGMPTYKFPFRVFELSLVSVPADINSGIYRGKTMTDTIELDTTKLSRKERREQNTDGHDEKQRVDCISGMAADQAHVAGASDLALKYIRSGGSYRDFNRDLLDLVGQANTNARQTSFAPMGARAAGMACDSSKYGAHMQKYSVTRLIRGLADPTKLGDCGLEIEISQDMQREQRKNTRAISVPWEALQTRAVTAGGSGSNLIETEHLASQFIDILRARSVVMSLGVTSLTGLVGDVAIPRKTTGASGYWIAGDGGDALTESDLVLDQLTLSPKTAGGAVSFSHKMISQSSPGIEELVRADLADMIAQEIDLKSINGTGANNQPTGVLLTSGIGANTSAGNNPTFTEMVKLETDLAVANADNGSLSYLVTPTIKGYFRATEKFSGSGVTIWEGDSVNGHAAHSTANMPDNTALFGDWSQLIVGFWGGIEIDADPFGTNFLKGNVTVRVFADVDFGLRHAAAFSMAAPA